jgi:hypothetical protein
MVKSDAEGHRLSLEQGTLHALIWAPPKLFVVDTPSARAVDLGCQYTLSVNRDGTGLLKVETGWVSLDHGGLESFIPAGASCRTRPGQGPGVPYYDDATEGLVQGLLRLDNGPDEAALRTVLREARPRDAITLWHLLSRTEANARVGVFDRFAGLVDVEVDRGAVLALDRGALEVCWKALGIPGW